MNRRTVVKGGIGLGTLGILGIARWLGYEQRDAQFEQNYIGSATAWARTRPDATFPPLITQTAYARATETAIAKED